MYPRIHQLAQRFIVYKENYEKKHEFLLEVIAVRANYDLNALEINSDYTFRNYLL